MKSGPALVAHICNSSYLGGWDGKDWGSRAAQANSSWDPTPPSPKWQSKNGLEVRLKHSTPALQAQSHEFKPQSHQTKIMKTWEWWYSQATEWENIFAIWVRSPYEFLGKHHAKVDKSFELCLLYCETLQHNFSFDTRSGCVAQAGL
jgi:hypothetical protein